MKDRNPSSSYCELIFLAGAKGRQAFTQSEIRIGRQPDNDFVAPDLGTSRIHAEIVWNDGIWKIRNLNPANKITLNTQVIQEEAELHHFDEIGLGRCSQTLIRFLTSPYKGDTPDPHMDTTAHMSQSPLDKVLSAENKHKEIALQDPLRKSQDSIWQIVSIILAAISAIITFFTLSPAMIVPGVITIFVGTLVCTSVVILARKESISFSYKLPRLYAMRKKTPTK